MQNPFNFFDAIYCINLTSRPDRWGEALESFNSVGIEDRVVRMPGVELKENPCRGNHLSHALCLRDAKEKGAKNCLIFEDDIEWLANAWIYLGPTVLELPPDWGLLYLGVNTERDSFQVTPHLSRLTSALATHAYGINHYLFDKLIEINESALTIHNDVSYDQQIIPNYPCFGVIPLLAGQRKSYSNIMGRDMESNGMFLDRFYGHLVRNRQTVKPTYVTFITPSLGRPSLQNTIKSLINQTDWNWEHIVMFDGIDVALETNDEHIHFYSCDKKGHAGLVRNEAFKYVDTQWMAFVDDDDFVKETYVQKLKQYQNAHPEADIIIFTYTDLSNGNTQPPPGSGPMYKYCNVGISFAIKTEFVRRHNITFPNVGCEDFFFLDSATKAGAKHFLTNDVQYFVSKRSVWQ